MVVDGEMLIVGGTEIPLFWAVLGFWVLLAMIITWFVTWASECSDTNPGPGAKRTSERLGNKLN